MRFLRYPHRRHALSKRVHRKSVVDLPSPGWVGKGHGTRWVGWASLGFWFLLKVGVGSRLRRRIAQMFACVNGGWGQGWRCRFLAGHRNDREAGEMAEDKRDGSEGCGPPPVRPPRRTRGRLFDRSLKVSGPATGAGNPHPLNPPLPQGL